MIKKNSELEWETLPPGMGKNAVISASRDSYTGLLELAPGDCFDFHHHQNQDEVIYVISGAIEMWLEKEKQVLGAGDSMVAPRGVVHACFNDSETPVVLMIVLSPLVPGVPDDMRIHEEYGWEMTDVTNEPSWSSLRASKGCPTTRQQRTSGSSLQRGSVASSADAQAAPAPLTLNRHVSDRR